MSPVVQSRQEPALDRCPLPNRQKAIRRYRVAALSLGLFGLLLAGCGGSAVSANPANNVFSIAPGSSEIDTNCAGCNAISGRGTAVHQFSATLNSGGAAAVAWSLGGGDSRSGPGSINADGQYTPPSFLTGDNVQVVVAAVLKSNPAVRATSVLTIRPGFLQPLTPENMALGANGTATVTGILAEAGGSARIRFNLADGPGGSSGGQGSLGITTCDHNNRAFTVCTVTYSAPPVVQGAGVTYVVAKAGNASARLDTAILLNAAGVVSNPAGHQGQLATPMLLGTSGGNNADFDARGNTIVDCCSGTLGALVQDEAGRQYLLGNNHVLARSDHAGAGDAVVQPGLIDNNCTPNGDGSGTVPVGSLTAWLPLRSSQTNVDAAIAEVASHTVDATGSILELGTRMADGSLAAAPPGVSSSGGKGEAASLDLRIAKSGRTTGLTCGGVSALDVDVAVDYFRDCAETKPYLTKTFTHQIGMSGNHFSDAGDSGALVVDTNNAEPVGLYFAGGADAQGVSQGIANPIGEVLSELGAQSGAGTNFSVVGGQDHGVSCLSYGDNTIGAAQSRSLSDSEVARAESALSIARTMVNAARGVLGTGIGKSSDHPGEAAVLFYVDANSNTNIPALVGGVRTVVVPSDARSVALGSAPTSNALDAGATLSSAAVSHAIAVKRQVARSLMQKNSAFFGIGVGQSLDNPAEAALVIYVDRQKVPAVLLPELNGLRTRYIVMDRMHVTRSYAVPFATPRHCMPHGAAAGFDPASLAQPVRLGLD